MAAFEVDGRKFEAAEVTRLERDQESDPLFRWIGRPIFLLAAFAVWLGIHAALWWIHPLVAIVLGIFLTPIIILATLPILPSRLYR